MSFGIMQGRLSPPEDNRFQSFPRNSWREEFPRAKAVGLDYIECIYDDYGASANPLTTDAGIAEINDLQQEHGVAVPSVCADWFMDFPFLRCVAEERKSRQQFLHFLLHSAARIGARHIVLPFVDISRIVTEEEKDITLRVLTEALPVAELTGVELHLETDLGPSDFAEFLGRLPHPMLKANYDSGNSSGLGYIAADEFAAYGDRIGSIHIKDRLRNPDGSVTTKPLGQGSANFDDVFGCMRQINYSGNITLQVARGRPGDEIDWVREQLAFVKRFWQ
ncbi:MAG TPA: sugar phosphate isomerase/epimerase family protein [Edaphobacter sp.]|jgi:L-ribulose-5-phosphate 3-epimerase|nr:sugar phosphate isomerase/epimerase family protein [Edaphobacter sp.]